MIVLLGYADFEACIGSVYMCVEIVSADPLMGVLHYDLSWFFVGLNYVAIYKYGQWDDCNVRCSFYGRLAAV